MFGMNQVIQIAQGWSNKILDKEKELFEKRMIICRNCLLYNKETDRCDSKRCYNKETGQMRSYPGDGFICGCNCVMSAKSRLKTAECVLNKWPE